MKGRISGINPSTGRYAIRLEDGLFTVFDMDDSHEPEIGDIVSGAIDSDGPETLRNETQGENFDVCIQFTCCSRALAEREISR